MIHQPQPVRQKSCVRQKSWGLLVSGCLLAAMCLSSLAARTSFGQTTAAPAASTSKAAELESSAELQLQDSSGRTDDSASVEVLDPVPAAESAAARRASNLTTLIASLTVFALAIFIGFEVITKVPPTLHTPLMSGSNAISGITVVGAILAAGHALGGLGSVLGMLAVILATVNVVGGFLVTYRMLLMFKKR